MVTDKYKSLDERNRIVKLAIFFVCEVKRKKCRPKATACHKMNLSVKINTKIGFLYKHGK